MNNPGEKIRKALQAKRMTQERLSAEIKVSQGMISAMVNNHKIGSLKTIEKVLKALDLNYEDVYGEKASAGQVVNFSGTPSVSGSHGAQQFNGVNFAPGANIVGGDASPGNPDLAKIIRLLEHYGSPALFQKIEEMIVKMYGEL